MIEVKNLTKLYGNRRALDNLNFTVNDGEILGFLGPNGAGKSTTMNIITGFLSATAGSVTVNGYDILEQPQKAKSRLGYLPEIPPLYEDMLVYEYLQFVAEIKKVNKKNQSDMLDAICDKVLIKDMKNRLIKNLSKGYKQRVGLAQAMIGNPDVLILDEPTVGLDPNQIIEMRNVIKDLGAFHTIILSSHILSEISAVCDRVMIISKGKIVASDTMKSLSKNLSSGNKLLLRIKGVEQDIISLFEKLQDIEDYELKPTDDENIFDMEVSSKDNIDIRETIFYALSDRRMPLLMMRPNELTLEEIFIKVTSEAEMEIISSEAEDKTPDDMAIENSSDSSDLLNSADNTDTEKMEGEV